MSAERITSEEQALRILGNRVIVGEVGVCDTAITVGNVSVGKKLDDGTTEGFFWEDENGNPDESRPYCIVNLRAMSEAQAEVAEEHLANGDYDEATNMNLSLRMSPEEVLKNRIATGALVQATFDLRESREGEDMLVCVGLAPIVSKAKKNSFKSRTQKAIAEAEDMLEGDANTSPNTKAQTNQA